MTCPIIDTQLHQFCELWPWEDPDLMFDYPASPIWSWLYYWGA